MPESAFEIGYGLFKRADVPAPAAGPAAEPAAEPTPVPAATPAAEPPPRPWFGRDARLGGLAQSGGLFSLGALGLAGLAKGFNHFNLGRLVSGLMTRQALRRGKNDLLSLNPRGLFGVGGAVDAARHYIGDGAAMSRGADALANESGLLGGIGGLFAGAGLGHDALRPGGLFRAETPDQLAERWQPPPQPQPPRPA